MNHSNSNFLAATSLSLQRKSLIPTTWRRNNIYYGSLFQKFHKFSKKNHLLRLLLFDFSFLDFFERFRLSSENDDRDRFRCRFSLERESFRSFLDRELLGGLPVLSDDDRFRCFIFFDFADFLSLIFSFSWQYKVSEVDSFSLSSI